MVTTTPLFLPVRRAGHRALMCPTVRPVAAKKLMPTCLETSQLVVQVSPGSVKLWIVVSDRVTAVPSSAATVASRPGSLGLGSGRRVTRMPSVSQPSPIDPATPVATFWARLLRCWVNQELVNQELVDRQHLADVFRHLTCAGASGHMLKMLNLF